MAVDRDSLLLAQVAPCSLSPEILNKTNIKAYPKSEEKTEKSKNKTVEQKVMISNWTHINKT